MRSLMSTSSNLVIFISVSKGGYDALVHHLETVVGAQPNCLESHRLDFFFSARTTFRRLRSLLAVIVVRLIFGTKIGIIFQIITRNSKNLQKSCKFSELSSLYTLNNGAFLPNIDSYFSSVSRCMVMTSWAKDWGESTTSHWPLEAIYALKSDVGRRYTSKSQ